MEIAAEHSKAQGTGTGEGVEKGFLLDRVVLKYTYIAGWNVKFPALIESDTADAGTAFWNGTTVAAGKTTDLPLR
jgi:hypothetical protein